MLTTLKTANRGGIRCTRSSRGTSPAGTRPTRGCAASSSTRSGRGTQVTPTHLARRSGATPSTPRSPRSRTVPWFWLHPARPGGQPSPPGPVYLGPRPRRRGTCGRRVRRRGGRRRRRAGHRAGVPGQGPRLTAGAARAWPGSACQVRQFLGGVPEQFVALAPSTTKRASSSPESAAGSAATASATSAMATRSSMCPDTTRASGTGARISTRVGSSNPAVVPTCWSGTSRRAPPGGAAPGDRPPAAAARHGRRASSPRTRVLPGHRSRTTHAAQGSREPAQRRRANLRGTQQARALAASRAGRRACPPRQPPWRRHAGGPAPGVIRVCHRRTPWHGLHPVITPPSSAAVTAATASVSGTAPRSGQPASRRGQRRVGGPVPLDRAAQLWRPVPLVDRRIPAVLGAGVPEAPVNEDGHPAGGERDVGPDPRPVVQVKPVVLAEPVARRCSALRRASSGLVSVRRFARMFAARPGLDGPGSHPRTPA